MSRRIPAGHSSNVPALAHIRSLLDQGATLAAVCRASGVKRSKIDHSFREGVYLQNGDIAALMRVTLSDCLAAENVVDAAPVRDHLMKIMATDGAGEWQLRKHIGLEQSTLHRLLDPETVHVKKAVAEKVLGLRPESVVFTRLNRTDPGPARDHIAMLLGRNVTLQQIADRSGVHATTIRRIKDNKAIEVDQDTLDWICGVTVDSVEPAARVDANIVRDHVLSLVSEGISRRQVSALAGVGDSTVRSIVNRRTATTSPEVAEQILAVRATHHYLVNPWGDIEEVRDHVEVLRAAGIPGRVIAAHAGMPDSNLSRITTGAAVRVTREVAERILAVHPYDVVFSPTTRVSAAGSIRRIQALNCAGWPTKHIARRLGLTSIHLNNRNRISKATADAIADVYESIKNEPGPSPRTAVWAQNKGLVAGIYWDDDTIDDPDAKPAPKKRPKQTRVEDEADAA